MAYVSIHKDLTAVKSKFLFGLTKRQTVCFGAAAVTGLPLFFFLRGILPGSAAALLMMFEMLPWFLFAMYERHGQPLERYLMNMINVKYRRPAVRTYQTENCYAAAARQNKPDEGVRRVVSSR